MGHESTPVLDLVFWVLRCRVCRKYHRGGLVNQNPRIMSMPLCGEYECPDLPGQKGYSAKDDWVQMVASEWETLADK
jgi:hypothetical protein